MSVRTTGPSVVPTTNRLRMPQLSVRVLQPGEPSWFAANSGG